MYLWLLQCIIIDSNNLFTPVQISYNLNTLNNFMNYLLTRTKYKAMTKYMKPNNIDEIDISPQ